MLTAKQRLFANAEFREIFTKLHALTSKHATSQPFIPVIAEDWGMRNLPKIIWYGAAPYEWDEGRKENTYDFDRELKLSEEWVANHPDRFPKSLFWRLQLNFLKRYNCGYDQSVWSNLYKIGGLKAIDRGNPSTQLKKAQYGLCLRAFEIECETLNPDIIVLHTGELANKLLYELTGSWQHWDIYQVNGKDVAACKKIGGVPYIWFTRDPNRLTKYAYPEVFSWCETKLNLCHLSNKDK